MFKLAKIISNQQNLTRKPMTSSWFAGFLLLLQKHFIVNSKTNKAL